MPTVDLTDAELTEVTALIRRAIEGDHFPLSRRLDLLRSALAKLDPAAAAALRRPPGPESPKPAPQKPNPPKGRPRPPESRPKRKKG
jgi:hypothetical protein